MPLPAPPHIEDFFERGSGLKLLLRGHPYDFVDTYAVLRHAYGYRGHHVNLGFWDDGLLAPAGYEDAGARLLRWVCARGGLQPGARVLDVGSGLGQAAVDLLQQHGAREVVGININARQLRFANALAAAAGCADRVSHHQVDACTSIEASVSRQAFDAVFAVECVGHFKDPDGFLRGVRHALAPGGVFVCCMNVARAPVTPSLRTMLRATYGFVPATMDLWRTRLQSHGLSVVEHGDITDAVLARGTAFARTRLRDEAVQAALPALTRALVHGQLAITARAVAAGSLGYAWLVARA